MAKKITPKADIKPNIEEPKLEPNPEFIAHHPGKKSVYAYNENGEFIGMTDAFECAFEKGVFHIPAKATDKAPLQPKEGYVIKFSPSKNSWIYETALEPVKEKEPEVTAEVIVSKRNLKLYQSDFSQFPDVQATLTQEQKDAWLKYRQDLRDLTKQSGFPDNIKWPEQPK
jgi:hypothetical protein